MSEIRPLEEGDLEQVARLLDDNLSAWGGDRAFLRAWMLESPWSVPETPSLVATDDEGALVGFIGVHAKRLRLDDRELAGVCCSHLAVDPNRRGGAAGALLLGRALRGPQDVSWSDTASPTVVRMWRTFGGATDNSRVCDWMLVLSPRRWLGSWCRAVARRGGVRPDVAPVNAIGAQAIKGGWPGGQALEGLSSDPVDAAGILEHAHAALAGRRLTVVDDRKYLEFQLAQIVAGSVEGVEPVTRLVSRDGRPIGWYLYLARPGGAARALAIVGRDRDLDAVLADLGREAASRGCTAVGGRLEPHLEQAVRRANAAVGLARQPMLKAADPALRAVLAGDEAVLTQLDGEWWV